MPKTGDRFDSYTYQNWGEYSPKRDSESRTEMLSEAYLAIPQKYAKKYDIYMSNKKGANTDYDAYDQNGNYICVLKAQGNVGKGHVYAKQFSGSGNLKALEKWIKMYNISDSDTIEIKFLSSSELKLTKV